MANYINLFPHHVTARLSDTDMATVRDIAKLASAGKSISFTDALRHLLAEWRKARLGAAS